MLKYIIIIYLPICNIFRVTNVTLNEVDQPLISDVIEVSVVSIHYYSSKFGYVCVVLKPCRGISLYSYVCTVQLKGNVSLARYCLAHISKTIHSIPQHSSKITCYILSLNHLNQHRDLSINNLLENYHSRDDLITA